MARSTRPCHRRHFTAVISLSMDERLSERPDWDRTIQSAICCMVLDPHGNLEPVDNMSCRFWQSTRQALEDFSAIREHDNVAKTAISLPSKRMPSSIPDCPLLGVGGDEIAAAGIAPTTATASAYNKLEASC